MISARAARGIPDPASDENACTGRAESRRACVSTPAPELGCWNRGVTFRIGESPRAPIRHAVTANWPPISSEFSGLFAYRSLIEKLLTNHPKRKGYLK